MPKNSFDKYQEDAEVTAGFSGQRSEERLLCGILALGGEVGELQNYVKKGIWHGHGVDPKFVVEELGDLLWYIAEVSSAIGVSMSDVAKFNIDKLKERYPEGFSEDASRNRTR
jgi:NTP pyrophosphatase (non-canonical NTP hydrolase)